MKRKILLYTLIVISSAQIANAQIKKGSLFLGGQVGFSHSKNEGNQGDSKQTSYYISPAIGIFTKDNLVWGGDIFFQGNNNNSGAEKTLYAGLGVFVRQYLPIVNRLYLFGQARFGGHYIWSDIDNAIAPVKTRGYGINLSLHPGISFAVKKNIQLETGFNNLASIGFTHTKRTQGGNTPGTSKSNSFGLNGNLDNATQIFIGLRFLVEKS